MHARTCSCCRRLVLVTKRSTMSAAAGHALEVGTSAYLTATNLRWRCLTGLAVIMSRDSRVAACRLDTRGLVVRPLANAPDQEQPTLPGATLPGEATSTSATSAAAARPMSVQLPANAPSGDASDPPTRTSAPAPAASAVARSKDALAFEADAPSPCSDSPGPQPSTDAVGTRGSTQCNELSSTAVDITALSLQIAEQLLLLEGGSIVCGIKRIGILYGRRLGAPAAQVPLFIQRITVDSSCLDRFGQQINQLLAKLIQQIYIIV